MGVLNDNTIIGASAAGDYEIKQSLRFNDDDSAYLSRTPSVAGNRKTWTWSGWHKRGNVDSDTALFAARTDLDNRIVIYFNSSIGTFNLYTKISAATAALVSTAVYRDASAWYHITVAFDTTQATASNRIKVYVNGEEIALTGAYLAQNADTEINNTVSNLIGISDSMGGNYADGYLAEVNFIDGLALTPDSFGETGDYGEWKPLKYTGAYGTNGFIQEFKDSGDLGKDTSGNGNDFTPTNLAATDQMLDSPTNNFATLNPLDEGGTNTVAEGNLQYDKTGANFGPMRGTLGVTTGKWYFEAMRSSNSNICQVGVSNNYNISQNGGDNTMGSAGGIGAAWDSRGYYYRTGGSDGGKNTFATNEIVSIAFDADTGKIWWRKSGGSWQDSGNPETGANPSFTASGYSELMPFVNGEGGGGLVANFGADSSFAGNKTPQGNQDANGIGDFYYAPPTGFLALCTANLPSVDVIPSEHFNTVLYTGNATARSIAGLDFQPDLTWIKARSATYQHTLVDSIRGTGNWLESNATAAEQTGGAPDAFNSDGFDLTTWGQVNGSGQTYAAWNWKANGTGVSNTNGTITSSVSANPSAGFSIVSYAGTAAANGTVGHGLSKAPSLYIIHDRTNGGQWPIYVESSGNGIKLDLSSTLGNAGTSFWNSTSPTASVFTIKSTSTGDVLANGRNYIAYAFHSVDGYSKVGSYTGNGSTDGTFVHCGFRPAYVMWKRTDAVAVWVIQDTTRDEGNTSNSRIEANSSAAEATDNANIDMLSNGFKMRQPYGYVNGSGATYIYLAFAESPFKYSNAR